MTEAKKPAKFVMTERDLAMLASLHEARYLTAEQLEWPLPEVVRPLAGVAAGAGAGEYHAL